MIYLEDDPELRKGGEQDRGVTDNLTLIIICSKPLANKGKLHHPSSSGWPDAGSVAPEHPKMDWEWEALCTKEIKSK